LALLICTALSAFALAAGSWSATGSMAAARYFHTATLLSSGKVIVTGGANGSLCLASAELYDPVAGTWSATASMATDRASGHSATLLPSGKVLVAAGNSCSGALASAELYDPVSGTWSATGSLATGRNGHTATLLPSGKVLVTGGANSGGYLASAELYDPVAGTWSATGSMAAARQSHTATLLSSGRVLVTGGDNSGGDLASAELYDPIAGTWSATGSMATGRAIQTATLLPSGKVLVAGGATANNSVVLASAELYDPIAGTWGATGSMATERASHTATLLSSGKMLVAGGNTTTMSLASAELYDPVAGTWSGTGSMATARNNHTATLLPSGKVLAAAGINGSGALASAELYQDVSLAPATLILTPATATNTVGATHCVTATVKDSSGNPSPSITVVFSVVGAQATFATPSSGSASTNSSGQATFCFTASLPGVNGIHAFADTNSNGSQDPGEPFGDATKTWVLPTSTQFCEVTITDGGWIIADDTDRANFGGNAKVAADGSVQGQQQYTDHGPVQALAVKSIQVTATTCDAARTMASIFGTATIDGAGTHAFRIDVTDNAPSTYGIMLDTGYASGQHPLGGGQITIH
jgi:hypothetical protein